MKHELPSSFGSFQILGYLGGGGMGHVYRARHATGREVALKVLNERSSADEELRKRFKREGALMMRFVAIPTRFMFMGLPAEVFLTITRCAITFQINVAARGRRRPKGCVTMRLDWRRLGSPRPHRNAVFRRGVRPKYPRVFLTLSRIDLTWRNRAGGTLDLGLHVLVV
jgi:hypothetical protein